MLRSQSLSMGYQLILQYIQISFSCSQPVFPLAAKLKTLIDEQLLAIGVGFVNGAIHLMEQHIIKKVFDAQGQGGFCVALLAEGFVDQDAQASPLVDGVVVENVDTAYGLSAFGQVNHQSKLPLAGQVVVVQKELLDLEKGVGHMRPTHSPDVAVVLPKENLTGILGLGATQCYCVILDEHIVQFVENTTLSLQAGT